MKELVGKLVTGVAGAYYYDNKTHTMHDKDDYFSNNAGEFS